MYRAEFFTIDALDHLPRALDVLRKMGFSLLDLRLTAVAGGARVHLVMDGATPRSAAIFAERISVLRGLARFSIQEMAEA